jgi:two-component system chemotaxis sensor kinase CheA
MDDLDEIVEEFLVESHENLDQLDRDLVELEGDPSSRELLSSIFRTVHTIKGTSGFLAFGILESVTHVGESLLSKLRDGEMVLDPALTTILLEMVDAVRSLLAQNEQTGTEGPETYADLVARLDAVLSGDTAVAVVPAAVGPAGPVPVDVDAEIEQLEHDLAQDLGQDLTPDLAQAREPGRPSVAESSVRVDVSLLDSLMNLVGELVLTRNQMLQCASSREDVELSRTTHRLNLIAGELQEGVMKTRMQTIDHVWSKLPRVVRDLSLQLGKAVDLQMVGRDTELDRTVLEAVRDPLTHLVRNSVDHGIELPELRAAAGKPERGTLTLRAFHEGGQVNIEIADDGAGIDPARLRAKAVERGMLTAEGAAALSDREAVNLVFAAGFSTAQAVTNVSGRGVGMDVVRTNIEKIGGSIDLASEPGRGTTVRIRIPLTLAIIPALIVTAAGCRYAVPQVSLSEMVRIGHGQRVEEVHGAPVYRLRGQLLPLVDLRQSLGLARSRRDTTYIAVLRADGRQFGLVVDEILDTEEIVVKPLGPQLQDIALYAGATIMGDGGIALILDSVALARKAGMTVEGGHAEEQVSTSVTATRSVLLVAVGDGRRAAIPLSSVDRLEEFPVDRVERVAGAEVLQYRGEILPLVRLDRALYAERPAADPDDGSDVLQVVVCRTASGRVGVVVSSVLDIVEEDLAVRSALGAEGHDGSAVVSGRVTELLDVDAAARLAVPAPTYSLQGA